MTNRQTGVSVGRLMGIPLALDYSWFLVFTLLMWTLANGYYPSRLAEWPPFWHWLAGGTTAILFFGSLLLHELGHSVVAGRYQVTVRGITLFVFGGVAEIDTEPRSAAAEFFIAIAGPIVSLTLALLCLAVQPAVAAIPPIWAQLDYLAGINLTFALFNLIPGFPLDGGRVAHAIVWGLTGDLRRATLLAVKAGRLVAHLLVLVGVWRMAVGDSVSGLWIAGIGWFLSQTASAQLTGDRPLPRELGH